jgi:hypothetical protein
VANTLVTILSPFLGRNSCTDVRHSVAPRIGDQPTGRHRQLKAKAIAVPLRAMKELGGRGDVAPTHSQLRH